MKRLCKLWGCRGDLYYNEMIVARAAARLKEEKIRELETTIALRDESIETAYKLLNAVDEEKLKALAQLQAESNLQKDLNNKLKAQLKNQKAKYKAFKVPEGMGNFELLESPSPIVNTKDVKFSPRLQSYLDDVLLGHPKPPLKPLPGDEHLIPNKELKGN